MCARLDERPLLELDSAADWVAWLAANHATSPGVWVAIGKKGGSATTLTYEQAVEEALCWGWIDSITRRLDDERFMQHFTPRKAGSIWSATNRDRVERLIAEGRMRPSGTAVIERARADGSWDALVDIDALVVPNDLADALAARAGAAPAFDALASTAKKAALYWIWSAKRPGTRAARVAATVEAALEGRAPV